MSTDLKAIRYLIEVATVRPGSALPTETHQSYPIPIATDVPAVAFLYAPSHLVRGQGLTLLPPSYKAIVLARDGHFQELRSIAPAEFSLPNDPTQPLGTYGLPEGIDQDAFLVYKDRLLETYDLLLPEYFAGTPPTAATVRTARDFRTTFDLISERVLRPYYRAVGRRFFTWLDTTAG